MFLPSNLQTPSISRGSTTTGFTSVHPQHQLTYRSRNSVEFHPKDLEWLSKDLSSFDWFNWYGHQTTEVNKESGDNNRVSNTRYLPMLQASPTEWSILNTVLLSFRQLQKVNQLYHTGIASSCNLTAESPAEVLSGKCLLSDEG